MGFCWSTYSTGYEDSYGNVHGVGVTDVSASTYCCHWAYATTTLTSPTGQQMSNSSNAHNAVTVDVQMALVIGIWTVETSHS